MLPSCQHQLWPRRSCNAASNPHTTRHTDSLALQHLAYEQLAVQASNYFNTPVVNPKYCQNRDVDSPISTDLSFPQWSFSCILWLDWSQLPATIIQLHLRLKHTSYWHRPSSWRPNTITTNFTHVCNFDKLSSLLYLLPCLCFLHCLWLSLLACI